MGSHLRSVVYGVALSLAFAASPAAARDLWTAPFSGVRHLRRVEPGVDLHVVLVDLENPEVSVVATRPEDRFITTTAFARRYDAQVALNANFYNQGSCGVAMGDGRLFERAYEDGCGASMAFGRANEAAVFDSTGAPRGPVPYAWVTEVFSGKPWLIRGGRALTNWSRPQHVYRPNPRTAAGLTRDRHTLVLLAADGRRRDAEGITGFQMVEVLREFGAYDAVNLDGGGSTTLVLGGEVANQLSDRRERAVITHLGVRITPGAVWYAGEILPPANVLAATEGSAATLTFSVRNTGRRPWKGQDVSAPVLELDDGEGAGGCRATLEGAAGQGETGVFTARWTPRNPGERALKLRLVAPDGALMGTIVTLPVSVRGARRVSAEVRDPPVMAASMGCQTAPSRGPSRLAWGCLAALGATVARLRRRRAAT